VAIPLPKSTRTRLPLHPRQVDRGRENILVERDPTGSTPEINVAPPAGSGCRNLRFASPSLPSLRQSSRNDRGQPEMKFLGWTLETGASAWRLAIPNSGLPRRSMCHSRFARRRYACHTPIRSRVRCRAVDRRSAAQHGRHARGASGGGDTICREIAEALNLPVVFWDERLTTIEATRRTQEAGAPRKTASRARRVKKSHVGLDAIAAAVILQDYMDNRGNGSE